MPKGDAVISEADAMPLALKLGTIVCLLSLFTFCALLSSSLLWPSVLSWPSSLSWPSWPLTTAPHVAPVPLAENPRADTPATLPRDQPKPPATTSVSVPPVPSPLHDPHAEPAQPVTLTVAIPPLMTPLVAGPMAGLPAVVTPAGGGGHNTSDVPVLVVPPRMPAGSIPAILRLPAGKGPFPAVIVLHGCNGAFPGTPAWAYRLNEWGYAALMPDSMTPRGMKNVCAPSEQPKVTPWDRVGDIGAAATWLRTRPEIDPARIAVLGLSHGGMTAALAVQTPYSGMRLRASVDYYGPCMEPRLHGSVPLLVLAGEADDFGEPAAWCRAYGQGLRPDQPFEIHTYPGVYHAFDGASATQTVYMGHILQHNQAAAEDSFIRVHAFLERWVRP